MSRDETSEARVCAVDDALFGPPAQRFLVMFLLDAAKQEVHSIHIDPIINPADQDPCFAVSYEKDGKTDQKNEAPAAVRPQVISHLFAMAGIGDNPESAANSDGSFALRLSKDRSAHFKIVTNLDPNSNDRITVRYENEPHSSKPEARTKTFEEVESEIRNLREMKSLKPPK